MTAPISEAPEPQGPTTNAGRRLGVDLEGMLGLQFKSPELYHAFLRDAERLAVEIEAEARAAAPPDLDVERLAMALIVVLRGTWASGGKSEGSWRHEAAAKIAAEYRRLASPDATRREPE